MPATGLEVKAAATAGVVLVETFKAIGPFVYHHFSATQRAIGLPGAALTKTDFNIEAILDILESKAGQKIPAAEREHLIETWKILHLCREALGPCTSLHSSWSAWSAIHRMYGDSKKLKFQVKVSSQKARANGFITTPTDVADACQANTGPSTESTIVNVFVRVADHWHTHKVRRKAHNSATGDLVSLAISEASEASEILSDDDDSIDSACDFQSVYSHFDSESDQNTISTGSD